MDLAAIEASMLSLDLLAEIVEFRGGESGGHIGRIRLITRILLETAVQSGSVELSAGEIEKITAASALHDIGKINVMESILLKPGRLSAVEYTMMQNHAMRGWEILNRMTDPKDAQYHAYCKDICRYHHERWDGGGYPDQLQGDAVPFWAQVVALADVYDALVSVRVYKQAYSHEKASKMIMGGECGTFGPLLRACFARAQDRLCEELSPPRESQ